MPGLYSAHDVERTGFALLRIRSSACQIRAKPEGVRGEVTVTPGETRLHDLHRCHRRWLYRPGKPPPKLMFDWCRLQRAARLARRRTRSWAPRPKDDEVRARLVNAAARPVALVEGDEGTMQILPPVGLQRLGERSRRPIDR
jgi:hypothetical protein